MSQAAKQLQQATEERVVPAGASLPVESLEDEEYVTSEVVEGWTEAPAADAAPSYTPRDYSDIWAKNIEF